MKARREAVATLETTMPMAVVCLKPQFGLTDPAFSAGLGTKEIWADEEGSQIIEKFGRGDRI
jgi:hypothetical protein